MTMSLRQAIAAPPPAATRNTPFETGEWCPTVPLSITPAWRLRTAQMGDGYSQRILDGINSLMRSLDVVYAIRPQATIVAMDTFLKDQKARAFVFKEPVTGELITVWCDEWSVTWDMVKFDQNGVRSAYGTLEATFVEAYGVTV
jgi:phage-related protein